MTTSKSAPLNLGVEYEFEGLSDAYDEDDNLIEVPDVTGWRYTEDGTLRNGGVEYVLRGKQPIRRIRTLIQRLLDTLDGKYLLSHRCSTHIHIDTTALNLRARTGLMLGLMVLDNKFFLSAKRKRNPYCCPLLFSPLALPAINKQVRAPVDGNPSSRRDIPDLCPYDIKYTSINVQTLHSIGTIELRHFEPLVDEEDLDTVLNLITKAYAIAEGLMKHPRRSVEAAVMSAFEKDEDLKRELDWVLGMWTTHEQYAGDE